MLVMMMLMVVVVTAALAILAMLVMMMLMVVVVTATLAILAMLVMVMLMVVVVTAALAVFTMLVMVMLVVMVVFITLQAFAIALKNIVVISLYSVSLASQFSSKLLKTESAFHHHNKLRAVQYIPRGGCNARLRILLSDKSKRLRNLILLRSISMRKYYRFSIFNLVVKEFAEILHIHSALTGIDNSNDVAKLRVIKSCIRNRFDYVGKLSYSRWLDKDSIRMEFVYNLYKRL